MFLRPLFFLIKVPKMSRRGDGGQQQLLHSKFLAGFVCHIEKNEVETNANTFCLHGLFLFLFPPFIFFLVFFISSLSLSFLRGYQNKNHCSLI